MSNYTKIKVYSILDKTILSCLFLYTLTFLLDIKVNFLTAAVCLGILKLFFVRPKIQISTKFFYIVGIFITLSFLSIYLNDVNSATSYNLAQYKSRFITPLTGLLIVFLFEFNRKRIILLLSGFSITFFINAIVLIYQFINNLSGRPTGLASSYMLLCGMNLLILPVIFAMAINKSDIPLKLRFFFALTILINIPAVLFSNTRIAWIGIFISFIITGFLSVKNKKYFLSIIAAFLIGLSLIFQVSPNLSQRFESIFSIKYENQSNSERILMWNSALSMIKDHPLFGVGVGNYHDQYMNKYRSPMARENQWHPHNTILDIFAEGGVFTGLSFIAMFAYLYYSVIKSYRQTKDPLFLAYLASLIAYNINFLTDSMFAGHNIKQPTTIFWLFTGIYFIVSQKIKITYKEKL